MRRVAEKELREEQEGVEVARATGRHVWKASAEILSVSPSTSSQLAFTALQVLSGDRGGDLHFPAKCKRQCCSTCFLPFTHPTSYALEVQPKSVLGVRLKRVVRRQEAGRKLSKYEKSLLERHLKQQSPVLDIICGLCKGRKKIPVRPKATETTEPGRISYKARIPKKITDSQQSSNEKVSSFPVYAPRKTPETPAELLKSKLASSVTHSAAIFPSASKKKRKGASKLQLMFSMEEKARSKNNLGPNVKNDLSAFLDSIDS